MPKNRKMLNFTEFVTPTSDSLDQSTDDLFQPSEDLKTSQLDLKTSQIDLKTPQLDLKTNLIDFEQPQDDFEQPQDEKFFNQTLESPEYFDFTPDNLDQTTQEPDNVTSLILIFFLILIFSIFCSAAILWSACKRLGV
jgi:hypothetical protein